MNSNENPNHQERNEQTAIITKDFCYYLSPPPDLKSVPASELRDAFIEGYVAAVRKHRIFDEALYLRGHRLYTHILGELIFAEQKAENATRARSRIIINNAKRSRNAISAATSVNPSDNIGDKRLFRGFVFDCAALDYDGRELDHATFEPISEHQPWPDVVYARGDQNGSDVIIDAEKYSELSFEEQKKYVKTRRYGAIMSSDIFAIADLIAEDIKIGDSAIVRRYLQEALNPNSELYPYRKVIMSAIVSLEHDTNMIESMITNSANAGTIRSMKDYKHTLEDKKQDEDNNPD